MTRIPIGRRSQHRSPGRFRGRNAAVGRSGANHDHGEPPEQQRSARVTGRWAKRFPVSNARRVVCGVLVIRGRHNSCPALVQQGLLSSRACWNAARNNARGPCRCQTDRCQTGRCAEQGRRHNRAGVRAASRRKALKGSSRTVFPSGNRDGARGHAHADHPVQRGPLSGNSRGTSALPHGARHHPGITAAAGVRWRCG